MRASQSALRGTITDGAVSNYPYLGVWMDREVDFTYHATIALGRGAESFNDMYGCAESLGFPIPLLTAATETRVVSKAMYGIEFCIGISSMESRLNRLQTNWAKRALGISKSRAGKHALLITECGWSCRLGTLMLENAIMLKARIMVLPRQHPARQIFEVARGSPLETWVSQVKQAQSRNDFDRAIPDIEEIFGSSEIEAASGCKQKRKQITRTYRQHHVRPILACYDRQAYVKAAETLQPWPYGDWQTAYGSMDAELMRIDGGGNGWHSFRAWAVVRVTGKWPFALYCDDQECASVTTCPLCGAESATIMHLLAECNETLLYYREWRMILGELDTEPRPTAPTLRDRIFAKPYDADQESPVEATARYDFVHRCSQTAAAALRRQSSEQG